MAGINFNPLHSSPPLIPITPQRGGTSAVTKIIMTMAAFFFGICAYIVFTRLNNSNNRVMRREERERQHQDQVGERLIGTNEERRTQREELEREYNEGLKIDRMRELKKRRREEITHEFTSLQDNLRKGIDKQKVRSDSLYPLDRCFEIFSFCFRNNQFNKKPYAEELKELEFRFKIETSDFSIPIDEFKGRFENFNTGLFLDESFQMERDELQKLYQEYCDRINGVYEKLAWVRLKKHYEQMGEETFKEQLSVAFLHRIREGKSF